MTKIETLTAPDSVAAVILNLTPSELAVLKSLAFNDYGDGGSEVWSWAINDSGEPSGIEGKALAGVVSSICKKGLYKQADAGGRDGSYLARTVLGDKVIETLFFAPIEEPAAPAMNTGIWVILSGTAGELDRTFIVGGQSEGQQRAAIQAAIAAFTLDVGDTITIVEGESEQGEYCGDGSDEVAGFDRSRLHGWGPPIRYNGTIY